MVSAQNIENLINYYLYWDQQTLPSFQISEAARWVFSGGVLRKIQLYHRRPAYAAAIKKSGHTFKLQLLQQKSILYYYS